MNNLSESLGSYRNKLLHTAGWESLMHWIIIIALYDLKHPEDEIREDAKEFLQSEYCQCMCECIDLDYNMIRSYKM